jgi:16S rRNA processing protein RimM
MPENDDISHDLGDASAWNIIVGRVTGHWDRALLKVAPFSEVPGRFASGKQIAVDWQGAKRLLDIRSAQFKGGAFVLNCGLSSEDAQALKGAHVWIHPSMRPAPPEGEFYYDQLIGLRVVTEEGRDLGEIEDVLESKAHMIYVTPRAMVPGVEEIVLSVDFETRQVLVKDVPGLEPDDWRD